LIRKVESTFRSDALVLAAVRNTGSLADAELSLMPQIEEDVRWDRDRLHFKGTFSQKTKKITAVNAKMVPVIMIKPF